MGSPWRGLEPMKEESDNGVRESAQHGRTYSSASSTSRSRVEYYEPRRSSTRSRGGSSSAGTMTALPSGATIPPMPRRNSSQYALPRDSGQYGAPRDSGQYSMPRDSGQYDSAIIGRTSRSDDASSQRRRLYLTDDDDDGDEREKVYSSPRPPPDHYRPQSRPVSRPVSRPMVQKQDDKLVTDIPPVIPPLPTQEYREYRTSESPPKASEEYLPPKQEQQEVRPNVDARDQGASPPAWRSSQRPNTAQAPPAPTFWSRLVTVSYLVFFSIMGTLARLGTQWLTFYPGAPIVTPVVWANLGGSFVIGFLAEDQQLFGGDWVQDVNNNNNTEKRHSTSNPGAFDKAEKLKRKKLIPLYIGLATGFCGSYTSFSSFSRDFFLALSNDLPTPISHPSDLRAALSTGSTIPRNGGYSFLSLLAVIIYTLALSLGGLIVGAHLASALHPFLHSFPQRFTQRILDPLFVFLGFGCWVGALFLAIFTPHEMWRGEVLFALVFAPVGCLIRYYVSQLLNPALARFPLGTFTVNVFGTAVEAMCYDVQHVGMGGFSLPGGGIVGCQVLQGVMDGFCGCLTTVSTWVAEIVALRRKHRYIYALASILVALALNVIIMGSVRWTIGWSEPVCNTGYPNKIFG